jgi:hypothetical protein
VYRITIDNSEGDFAIQNGRSHILIGDYVEGYFTTDPGVAAGVERLVMLTLSGLPSERLVRWGLQFAPGGYNFPVGEPFKMTLKPNGAGPGYIAVVTATQACDEQDDEVEFDHDPGFGCDDHGE